MKKFKLFIITLSLFFVTFSCARKEKPIEAPKPPLVDYCFELQLVNGNAVKDTITLYEGTTLAVNAYKGAYGIQILNYYPLYVNGAYYTYNSYIIWGVVHFKLDAVLPVSDTTKKLFNGCMI